jgi:hypothetical protein
MSRLLVLTALCLAASSAALAVGPPHRINYQGVLRDASGAPRTGSFDMTFRFFDDEDGGAEILVDAHLASGTGAVAALDGLFNVEIGSGNVMDGSALLPGDPYLSLARVFEDFTDVWMEIVVAGEVLVPRVSIVSAPFALQARTALDALNADLAVNALSLGGLGPSSFLNTSSAAQTKIGNLRTDGTLIAGGNQLRFNAPGAVVSASDTTLVLQAGDQPTDSLVLQAGFAPDLGSGMIRINGESEMTLWSGNGRFQFMNGNTFAGTAVLTETGQFVAHDLTAENGALFFLPSGAIVSPTVNDLRITAGYDDGDDLFLNAGNDSSDGAIEIRGDSAVTVRSGNGQVDFVNGATGGALATLASNGRFTATQDLVALGQQLHLGTPGTTRIVHSALLDDLTLYRDDDNDDSDARFAIYTNGGTEQMRIEDGNEAPAKFDGAVTVNGLDYAEAFWVTDPTLVAGEVVAFDPARPGFVVRATDADGMRLAGVISERPGFVTGGSFDAEEAADLELASSMHAARDEGDDATAREISALLERKRAERQRPVALAGRLPVRVDAAYGPIRAGDALTASQTPGYARVQQEAGPSIGIALESFDGPGTGTVLAFVQRGHHTPAATLAEAQAVQAVQEERVRNLEARAPDPTSVGQVLPSSLQVVLDALRPRSMGLAETFAVSEPVEPGDVLVVDRRAPGHYARCSEAGDPTVVGVVAADPGVLLGGDIRRVRDETPAPSQAELEQRFGATRAAVALSGTVRVKVDAGYGSIVPGDLLISSPTAGHAMRAPDPAAQGTVLGKALEPLATGVGTIRMLVVVR